MLNEMNNENPVEEVDASDIREDKTIKVNLKTLQKVLIKMVALRVIRKLQHLPFPYLVGGDFIIESNR